VANKLNRINRNKDVHENSLEVGTGDGAQSQALAPRLRFTLILWRGCRNLNSIAIANQSVFFMLSSPTSLRSTPLTSNNRDFIAASLWLESFVRIEAFCQGLRLVSKVFQLFTDLRRLNGGEGAGGFEP